MTILLLMKARFMFILVLIQESLKQLTGQEKVIRRMRDTDILYQLPEILITMAMMNLSLALLIMIMVKLMKEEFLFIMEKAAGLFR